MIWVVRVLMSLVILFWVAVFLGARRAKREGRWRLTPNDEGLVGAPRISVVIPARNEVDNIGRCLDGVLAQDAPDVQVVVIDDGSDDGTGEVLARYADRVEVLSGGDAPLPQGWLGKPWACHRASQQATGGWLVFIDADVELSPRALSVLVGYAQRNELGMLSGLGQQECRTFWEKVLQPAVGGLILAGNDLDKQNDPEVQTERPLANGQFLCFAREAYETVGGHTAVKDDVLDDVGLAIAAKNAGIAYHLVFCRELFSVRMYDSLSAIWEGWTKNLFAGMDHRWGVLVGAVTFVVVSNLSPYLIVFAGFFAGLETLLWGLAAVVVIQLVRAWLDGLFGQDWRYSAFHALGSAMLCLLLVHSGIKSKLGTRSWKGRTIDVPGGA